MHTPSTVNFVWRRYGWKTEVNGGYCDFILKYGCGKCVCLCVVMEYIYIFVQLIYNNKKRLPKTESSTVSRKAANKTFSNCLCVRKLRIRF